MSVELNSNQIIPTSIQKQLNPASRVLGIFNLKQQTKVPVKTENDYQVIMDCIKEAYNEWVVANKNFEYADEIELVDYYIYRVKSCELRYQYYLKKAKEIGLNTFSISE